MKKVRLHLPVFSCFSAMAAWVICALLGFTATTASAQANASVAAMPPISVEDLGQVSEWKTPVDYAAVLVSERNNTAATLATPNLKDAAIALYTGYDRLLEYMQQGLIDNVPIEEIAEKSYDRVVGEAPADPVLLNMDNGEFNALYQTLLGMLHQ